MYMNNKYCLHVSAFVIQMFYMDLSFGIATCSCILNSDSYSFRFWQVFVLSETTLSSWQMYSVHLISKSFSLFSLWALTLFSSHSFVNACFRKYLYFMDQGLYAGDTLMLIERVAEKYMTGHCYSCLLPLQYLNGTSISVGCLRFNVD